MTSRLTAEFWVAAYLAQLQGAGIFAHILHKGDETAGAIAIKIALMNGYATLFTRVYDDEGRQLWAPALETQPESEVDEYILKQRKFDRDLWVIEIEDPRGRHLLDEFGGD